MTENDSALLQRWTRNRDPEAFAQVAKRYAGVVYGTCRRVLGDEAEAEDVALCSHFLFLYSDHLSYEFHYASIREMLRVAKEARIFPLLTLSRQRSLHLQQLVRELSAHGFQVDICPSRYELQKGGNEMLVVRHTASPTSTTRSGNPE